MASTALALSSKNGSIEFVDDGPTQVEIMKTLGAKDRAYVRRISDEIAELTILEQSLTQEEAKFQRIVNASDAMQNLKKVRAQMKRLIAQRRDKVQKGMGVMEAAYQEYMPGHSFGEKVMSMLPAPDELPKATGTGHAGKSRTNARGGKRR